MSIDRGKNVGDVGSDGTDTAPQGSEVGELEIAIRWESILGFILYPHST